MKLPEELLSAPIDLQHQRPPPWGAVLRRALVHSFYAFSLFRFCVHVRGLEHCTNQSGTLVVCNHRSDYDMVVLPPLLIRTCGGDGPISRMAFVAADRLYGPGFVARDLLGGRWWARRLTYGLTVAPALEALRAYPIPWSMTRPLEQHLQLVRELVGDLELTAVFASNRQRWLPGAADDRRISDVLCWRYGEALARPTPLSAFRDEIRHALRRVQIDQIKRSLERFCEVLDDGDAVLMAPEGQVNHGSELRPIRAGVCRLLQGTRRPITMLPVSICYESGPGDRPHVFVDVRREVVGLEQLERAELNRLVAERITPDPAWVAATLGATAATEGGDRRAVGAGRPATPRGR
jgi:1-acyl-sn-glycerol-3-phosphate acyltransferase